MDDTSPGTAASADSPEPPSYSLRARQSYDTFMLALCIFALVAVAVDIEALRDEIADRSTGTGGRALGSTPKPIDDTA